MDLLGASLVLLLCSPVLLACAVAVKASSPGPVLFRQDRVGLGGKRFRIRKFRTMHVTDGAGPQVTAAGDARITAVGRVLRRSKLDELPQLIDVLVGNMSLVGPRPEVPRYIAQYPEEVRAKILSVRPGITDNAAIAFRDEERMLAASSDVERTYVEQIMPIKQRYYLDYVAHRSVAGDLAIIGRTVWAIAGPKKR
ncbi:sugar transferase [Diaphorobacter aerolatus]|uniref:Sugar transferase n=2 Tax=Diaphorobacter aerolatus TaxID=1288495 RepID=A0A7H0GQN4_9BURK|nr:sugar transferase [Diaphorobacter aerolatus]QNP50600.1 sugar transferase [Diaphorobacter aerolatus]